MDNNTQKITDITSSEGNLKRLSNICTLIETNKYINRHKMIKKIRVKLGLSNEKVIVRHMSILQSLNLLQNVDEKVKLTDDGRALSRYLIVNDFTKATKLSYFEKILFIKQILMNSFTRIQILELMNMIKKYRNEKDIIYNYFDRKEVKKTWNISTIERNIKRMDDSGIVPRTLKNRYLPFRSWLLSLGLIKKTSSGLELTDSGNRLIKVDRKNNIEIFLKNYSDSESSVSREFLINQLFDAIKKYKMNVPIVNFLPIKTIFFIEMLSRNIFIESEEIYVLLRQLANDKKVKSLVVGKRGLPTRIII